MTEKDELKKLFSISEKDFGEKYKEFLLEQYKLFLQMTDNLNHRRSLSNSFFLSVNTGLLSALGLMANLGINVLNASSLWIILGAIGGILFSYSWIRIVTSYSQLSYGKWTIIQEIERHLPLSLYEIEWKILGEGKIPKKYKPLTNVEKGVPIVFIVLYGFLVIISIVITTKIITF